VGTLNPGEWLVVPFDSTITASGSPNPFDFPDTSFPFYVAGQAGVAFVIEACQRCGGNLGTIAGPEQPEMVARTHSRLDRPSHGIHLPGCGARGMVGPGVSNGRLASARRLTHYESQAFISRPSDLAEKGRRQPMRERPT
jgi:hypothetical protein